LYAKHVGTPPNKQNHCAGGTNSIGKTTQIWFCLLSNQEKKELIQDQMDPALLVPGEGKRGNDKKRRIGAGMARFRDKPLESHGSGDPGISRRRLLAKTASTEEALSRLSLEIKQQDGLTEKETGWHIFK